MKQVTTTFESYEEACRFIALYAGCYVGSPEYNVLLPTVPGYEKCDAATALTEAIKLVAERNRVAVAGAAVPTWTNTTGTQRICDMPTRHLKNILRRYDLPEALTDAIETEVRSRA